MKKIAFMMLALAATLSFASCNDSESEYATDVAYATVSSTSPVMLMTDDNQQLVVADCDSAIGSYTPSFGQRALIYYTPLTTADGKKSNQIKLYGYIHFDQAESEILAAGEEVDFGQLPVDIYQTDGNYYLVHATKDVIDMTIMFTATDGKLSEHVFTLVLDEDEPVVDGYLNLLLAHSASEAEQSAKTVGAAFFTFDMLPFTFHMGGTNGVRITAKGIEGTSPVEHKFEWAE